MGKFNGRNTEVRQTGSKTTSAHQDHFNGYEEPAQTRNVYSVFDSASGERLGSFVPTTGDNGRIVDTSGQTIGSVKK